MAFLAVKNRLDKPATLTQDSKHVDFEPNQVIIIDEVMGKHANKLYYFGHPVDKEGKPNLQKMYQQKRFEIVPLEQAIKDGAKMPESQEAIAERQRVTEEVAKKKALIGEIMGELQAAGWKAPEAKEKRKHEEVTR